MGGIKKLQFFIEIFLIIFQKRILFSSLTLVFSNAIFSQNTVLFLETFGTSTTRIESEYMPSNGFIFASTAPSASGDEKKIGPIHYAVIDPTKIKNGDTTGAFFIWSSPIVKSQYYNATSTSADLPYTEDKTPDDTNGAVMVVNGGNSERPFYRRAVTLVSHGKYELEFYNYMLIYPSELIIEIRDKNSNNLLITKTISILSESERSIWKKYSLKFDVPSGCTNPNVTIVLKTKLSNNLGRNYYNDFYIDDIKLTQIGYGSSGVEQTLPCQVDTDSDGVFDNLDTDDDSDGTLDSTECGYCSAGLVNGNFESPIQSVPYIDVNLSANKLASGLTNGWYTTENNRLLEYWRSGENEGIPAKSGNQLVELNLEPSSTIAAGEGSVPRLYQVLCVNGLGGTLDWSVWHRGRYGTDKAIVQIGSTIGNLVDQTTMSTGNVWTQYSGSYSIPVGTTKLVFAIQSLAVHKYVSTNTSGNLLDDIKVTMRENCVDTDGDGLINSLDTDSDNDYCSDRIEYSGNPNILANQSYGTPSTANIAKAKLPILIYNNELASKRNIETCDTSPMKLKYLTGAKSTTAYDGVGAEREPIYYGPNSTDISSGLSYKWQVDGVDILTSNTSYSGSNTNELTILNPTLHNGKKYRLVMTHPEHACPQITNSTEIVVEPLPTSYAVSSSGILCTNGNGVTIELSNSESDVKYQLLKDNVNVGQPINGSTGSTLNFGSFSFAGTYTVKATRDGKTCTATMSGSIIISEAPSSPTITRASTEALCTGDTVLLTSTATSNNSWYKNGELIDGATGSTLTVSESGNYTATVQGVNCQSDPSNEVEVEIVSRPARIVTNATICFGESYTWSANSQSYTTTTTVDQVNEGCVPDQRLILTVIDVPTKPNVTIEIK